MDYDEAKDFIFNGDGTYDEERAEVFLGLVLAVTDENINKGLKLIKELTLCDDDTAKLLWEDLKCDSMAEIEDARQAREEHQKEKENTHIPKCPTCGSPNISKLGIVNKYVSIYLVGLASNKVAKTFKCKNCGYTW